MHETADENPGGEILAIGPYHRDLAPYIDNVRHASAPTREGTVVVALFEFVEGNARALRELAACFHAHPWDFNTHALDPWHADLQALRAFDQGFNDDGLVDKLLVLRAAGFQFYLRLYPPVGS